MKMQAGFFRSVKPLPKHKLEVVMQTDTHIVFDFTSRLGTMRFGALVDDELFNSARTDGNFIPLFGRILPDFSMFRVFFRKGAFPHARLRRHL